MTSLVTGATGVVGGHLAKALLQRGERVRVLVRPTADAAPLAARGAEVVTGLIQNPDDVRRAFEAGGEQVRVVYHIAAVFRTAGHPDSYYHAVNVRGVEHVLDAAARAGVSRVVHCSTIGVQGDIRDAPATEESPANPGDIYQRTKLLGEQAALAAFRGGLPGVVVRPASVYGPGDLRLLKLFRALQRGAFCMLGSGRTLFHPVYIDDLTDGIIRAAQRDEALGEVFTLAGPRYVTLREFVDRVARAVGVRPPRLRLPVWPFLAAGALCEAACIPLGLEPPLHRRRVRFFTKNRAFSIEKARRLLGYHPKVDVAEGVARTALWYAQHGHLRPLRHRAALPAPAAARPRAEPGRHRPDLERARPERSPHDAPARAAQRPSAPQARPRSAG